MNCIRILTVFCGSILFIALILSHFHISLLTNYVYKYGNLYKYSKMASYKSDKVRKFYKRQNRVKEQFSDRTVLMSNICEEHRSKLEKDPPEIQNNIWSIAPGHNMIMCRTAKHGSTTWANIFVQILVHAHGILVSWNSKL